MDWIERLDEESFWHPAEGEARSRELLGSRLHALTHLDQTRLLAVSGTAALRVRLVESAEWAISSAAEYALGDPNSIAKCCARLSAVRKRQGRIEDAQQAAEAGVVHAKSPEAIADSLLSRASLKLTLNQGRSGLLDALRALEYLNPDRGSQFVSATSMVASSLRWLGHGRKALAWIEQAEDLTSTSHDGVKFRSAAVWAGIYSELGEPHRAESLYRECIKWFAMNGYPWEAAACAVELAALLFGQDRLGAAYELAKFSFPILSVIRAEDDAYSAYLVLFKSIEMGTLRLHHIEKARAAIQNGRLKPVANCRSLSYRS